MSKHRVIPTTPEMWREVCEVQEANDPGYTAKELVAILGKSESTIRSRMLPELIKENKCTRGLGTRVSSSGQSYQTPVYELKK